METLSDYLQTWCNAVNQLNDCKKHCKLQTKQVSPEEALKNCVELTVPKQDGKAVLQHTFWAQILLQIFHDLYTCDWNTTRSIWIILDEDQQKSNFTID